MESQKWRLHCIAKVFSKGISMSKATTALLFLEYAENVY